MFKHNKFIMVITVLLFAGFSWGAFMLFDTVGCEEIPAQAKLTDKCHIAAYTSTIFIKSGDVMIPQIINHPAQYLCEFNMNDEIDSFDAEDSIYNQLAIGATYSIMYKRGRISKLFYVTKVIL